MRGTTHVVHAGISGGEHGGEFHRGGDPGGPAGQVFTVSDTRGNTYRRALQINQTLDTTTVALYYAENIAGGANTVTVSDTVNGGTLRFAILEYAGVATASALDKTGAAEGTGTAVNSGAVTTTSAGQLVLGLIATAGGTSVTAGTGLTRAGPGPGSGDEAGDDRSTTGRGAGTIAATATLGATDAWGALMATFRAGTVARRRRRI